MAIEDAGVLALLIQRFGQSQLERVCDVYERMRVPRTTSMLEASMGLGKMQMSRAMPSNWLYTMFKEVEIKVKVGVYGTLPVMLNGSGYDYRREVDKYLLTLAKL